MKARPIYKCPARHARRRTLRSLEALEARQLLAGLVVSEIMYNPPDPPAGSQFLKDDFEYIELLNTGPQAVDLTNVMFVAGIHYSFTGGSLGVDQRVALVRNAAAFGSRYPGVSFVGPYTGALDNGGEQLIFNDGLGVPIQDFTYNNSWEPLTDGQGFSLVIIDPTADPTTWSLKDRWRPSMRPLGAPGASDPGLVPEAIVINELLSHTDEALGDWIELHNNTNQPIDISGWYLSDRTGNLAKYRIPNGTVVQANGYVTFTQFATFGSPSQPDAVRFSFAEAGNELDEPDEAACLTAADPGTGELLGYREVQAFRPSDREVTFGLHTKTTGGTDFVPMSQQTFGGPNALPRVSPVVFNEIMFAPQFGGDEYIEIRNLTDQPRPLFDPAHPENTWRFADGIEFEFPTGVTLAAGALALVVPIDPVTFRNKYAVPAEVQILGPYIGALNDGGENLELRYPGDPETLVVYTPYYLTDRVNYANTSPWPGILPGSGPSLARRIGEVYGNEPTNWGADVSGGTPGRTNSNSPLTLTVNSPSRPEGSAGPIDFTFTVRLSESPTAQVSVHYETANGTATAPADYAVLSRDLTFSPGTTSQRVTVSVVGDATIEPDETILLNLSNPLGATLGIAQGVGTLENDDLIAEVGLIIDDAQVQEGNGGTANLVFTIRLSEPSADQISVSYETQDQSAQAITDYTAASGAVTFAPNDTSKTITVTVLGDTNVESDETLFVNLSNPSGAFLSRAQAVGTILSEDLPTISITDPTVIEGNAGSTNLVFNLSLSVAVQKDVTFHYATADGGTTAPGDYVAKSGTLTFLPGLTTQAITVVVNGDTTAENNETMFVNLSSPVGATLAKAQGIGTISNDDLNPSPWKNLSQAVDVDNDGSVVPLDALLIINELDRNGAHALAAPAPPNVPPPFYDVDGDNFLAPVDALIVINYLDAHAALAPPAPQMAALADAAFNGFGFEPPGDGVDAIADYVARRARRR